MSNQANKTKRKKRNSGNIAAVIFLLVFAGLITGSLLGFDFFEQIIPQEYWGLFGGIFAALFIGYLVLWFISRSRR